ncbi:helix-turn-helix domain-containing protein (plasmid) [Halorussus limi]|uniref:Helix-turn-helix domain-containing protein n=1 Tax=Halorussus limi TaxID=2938695 RepID=A0A8U0I0H0_9EURY|nr:helix-turn-helix domain-containing protein [Halorussus limi]UPV76411.1 helix-turn-helix domain-containing protein [Halorussus limi]
MADLLPSSPDPSAGDGGEPKVVGVDSDDADDLLAALQSETARDLLAALYDDPATPSELAETADTSIQNVRYHLERLTDADLVEVADTVYSEKGREMKVYAPAAKPLVVFAGGDDEVPGLESALSRLLGGLGVLGLSSLLVQRFFGGPNAVGDSLVEREWSGQSLAETTAGENLTAPSVTLDAATTRPEATRTAADGVDTKAEATRTTVEEVQTGATPNEAVTEATRTVTEEAATTVATSGSTGGLPPGVVFFAGGLAVLLALGVAWYVRAR